MSRQEAFEKLAPIAHRAAQRYKRRLPPHACTDDLLNVALMGVWEAVTRRYDKGVQAMTALAIIRAQGAIVDFLRARDWTSRKMRRDGEAHALLSIDVRNSTFAPPYEVLIQRRTPEDEAAENQLAHRKEVALEAALQLLCARERYIVRRLLTGVKQADLANELNVSAARISQIMSKVLPVLKLSIKGASRRKELW